MWYAIDGLSCLVIGFVSCWIFKGKLTAQLGRERDQMKSAAIRSLTRM
jgi:hypothetical protein